MDEKQEACFTETIQWVIDEAKWREENPGERSALQHNQHTWGDGTISETVLNSNVEDKRIALRVVCGTGCCVAGAAVLHAGDQFVIGEEKAQEVIANRDARVEAGMTFTRPLSVSASWCVDAEGNLHGIPERASNLMGLDYDESHRLFAEDNTANDIMVIAGDIARRHKINPEFIF